MFRKFNPFIPCLLSLLIVCFSYSFTQAEEFRKRANLYGEDYSQSDVEAEIVFGREVAAKVLGRHSLLDNEEIQRYISLLGNGIALQIGRSELKYYFAVLDMEDVNAYACPGGYIFITKGALQVMTNEAQLVGVLAHEIAHVDRKHVVNELGIKGKDDSVTSGIAGILGGSSSSVRVALDMLANRAYSLLFEEGISKEAELEADGDAIVAMVTVGYDWQSYRNFVGSLNKMIYAGHGKVLSKTHPKTENRLNQINRIASENEIANLSGKINADRFGKYMKFEELSVAEDFSDFDIKVEISWGREIAARILGKYPLLENETLQKYVNLLGKGISAQVGRPELNYYFAVLATEEVKTISSPGGYIFISKGAIQKMSDEAQLVGMLAREVAHVDRQHLVQQVQISKKAGSAENIVRLPISVLSDYAFSLLEEEGLSEKYELESDAQSVEMMTTIGFDWKSYRQYVSKLSNLKNYPAPATRLDTIDKTATQIGLGDYEGKTNVRRFKESVRF